MSEKIKVAIRIRPLIDKEKDQKIEWQTSDTTVSRLDNSSVYTYDHVYGTDYGTDDIFDDVVTSIIDGIMDGYNGTVFAYGQTSSGKTHTMFGDQKNPGIIPLSVFQIFSHIENTPDREYLLRISFMEIYNDHVYDLLGDINKSLEVREDKGNVFVATLAEQCVTSVDDLLQVLEVGNKKRRFGSTHMNEKSSRSHTILRLIVESRERATNDQHVDGAVRVSHLNLVDLAGSEKVEKTRASGQRLKEGAHINTSLTHLSRVISQLAEQAGFVSYRDSKLTRILQNALGGNSRTLIICAVTPAATNVEETHSTLRFATSAKKIKNKPVMNEVLSNEAELNRCRQLISDLQKQLEVQTTVDYRANYEQLSEQNKELNKLLEEREVRETELHQKLSKLSQMICVSTKPLQPKADFNALKKRRQTWCPGREGGLPGLGVGRGRNKFGSRLNSASGAAMQSFETLTEEESIMKDPFPDHKSVDITLPPEIREIEEEQKRVRFTRPTMSPPNGELSCQLKVLKEENEQLHKKCEKLMSQMDQTKSQLLSRTNHDLDLQKKLEMLEASRKNDIEIFSKTNKENQELNESLTKQVHELRCSLQKAHGDKEVALQQLSRSQDHLEGVKQEVRHLEDLQLKHRANDNHQQEQDPQRLRDRLKKLECSLDLTNQRCQNYEGKMKKMQEESRRLENAAFERDRLRAELRHTEEVVRTQQGEITQLRERYSASFNDMAKNRLQSDNLSDKIRELEACVQRHEMDRNRMLQEHEKELARAGKNNTPNSESEDLVRLRSELAHKTESSAACIASLEKKMAQQRENHSMELKERSSEIQYLEKLCDSLNEQLAELPPKLEQKEETIKTLEGKIMHLESAVNSKEENNAEVSLMEENVKELQSKVESQGQELKEAYMLLEQYGKELDDQVNASAQLQKELKSRSSADACVAEVEEKLQVLSDKKDSEIAELQNKLEEYKKELAFKEEEIIELGDQLQDAPAPAFVEQLQKDLEETRQKVKESIGTATEELEQKEATIAEMKVSIEQCRIEKEERIVELKSQLDTEKSHGGELQELVDRLQSKLEDLQMQASNTDTDVVAQLQEDLRASRQELQQSQDTSAAESAELKCKLSELEENLKQQRSEDEERRQCLQTKVEKNEDLQREYDELLELYAFANTENEDHKSKIADLELCLKQQQDEHQNEICKLKTEAAQTEAEQRELQELQERHTFSEIEIADYKSKISELEESLKELTVKYEQEVFELKNQNVQKQDLQAEHTASSAIEEYQSKISELEGFLSQQKISHKDEIDSLKTQLEQSEGLCQELKQNMDGNMQMGSDALLMETKEKLETAEVQIHELTQELEETNMKHEEKITELKEFWEEHSEEHNEEVEMLKSNIKNANMTITELEDKYQMLQKDKDALDEDMLEMQEKLVATELENADHKSRISELEESFKQQMIKHEEKVFELETQLEQSQGVQREIQDLRASAGDEKELSKSKISELEECLDQLKVSHKEQIVNLKTQLEQSETLYQELKLKMDEVQSEKTQMTADADSLVQMKGQLETAEIKIQQLTQEMEESDVKHEEKMAELRKFWEEDSEEQSQEVDMLKSELKNANMLNTELENRIQMLQKEKCDLDGDISALKEKVEAAEQAVHQAQKDHDQAIKVLQSKLEQTKRASAEQVERSSDYANIISAYEAEIDQLKKQRQKYEEEIFQLSQQLKSDGKADDSGASKSRRSANMSQKVQQIKAILATLDEDDDVLDEETFTGRLNMKHRYETEIASLEKKIKEQTEYIHLLEQESEENLQRAKAQIKSLQEQLQQERQLREEALNSPNAMEKSAMEKEFILMEQIVEKEQQVIDLTKKLEEVEKTLTQMKSTQSSESQEDLQLLKDEHKQVFETWQIKVSRLEEDLDKAQAETKTANQNLSAYEAQVKELNAALARERTRSGATVTPTSVNQEELVSRTEELEAKVETVTKKLRDEQGEFNTCNKMYEDYLRERQQCIKEKTENLFESLEEKVKLQEGKCPEPLLKLRRSYYKLKLESWIYDEKIQYTAQNIKGSKRINVLFEKFNSELPDQYKEQKDKLTEEVRAMAHSRLGRQVTNTDILQGDLKCLEVRHTLLNDLVLEAVSSALNLFDGYNNETEEVNEIWEVFWPKKSLAEILPELSVPAPTQSKKLEAEIQKLKSHIKELEKLNAKKALLCEKATRGLQDEYTELWKHIQNRKDVFAGIDEFFADIEAMLEIPDADLEAGNDELTRLQQEHEKTLDELCKYRMDFHYLQNKLLFADDPYRREIKSLKNEIKYEKEKAESHQNEIDELKKKLTKQVAATVPAAAPAGVVTEIAYNLLSAKLKQVEEDKENLHKELQQEQSRSGELQQKVEELEQRVKTVRSPLREVDESIREEPTVRRKGKRKSMSTTFSEYEDPECTQQ